MIPEFNDHHYIPRSLGGTETIRICIECHNFSHDGRHAIIVRELDNLVHLVDTKASGPAFYVYTRPLVPMTDVAVQDLVNRLEQGRTEIGRLAAYFDKLPDDQMERVGKALIKLHESSWLAVGSWLSAVKRRIQYGQKGEQFPIIAREFQLGEREAYRYIEAADYVQAHPETFATMSKAPVSIVLEAKKHDDPAAVVELWEAVVDERPGAGLKELRAALRGADVHQTQYCGHSVACPHCGRTFGPHEAKERSE